jgi:gamma-glutamyl-gamma-aminobutyrate hydrolase PuuD
MEQQKIKEAAFELMTKAIMLKDMIDGLKLAEVNRTLIDATWHIEYAIQVLKLSNQTLARKVYGGNEHNKAGKEAKEANF